MWYRSSKSRRMLCMSLQLGCLFNYLLKSFCLFLLHFESSSWRNFPIKSLASKNKTNSLFVAMKCLLSTVSTSSRRQNHYQAALRWILLWMVRMNFVSFGCNLFWSNLNWIYLFNFIAISSLASTVSSLVNTVFKLNFNTLKWHTIKHWVLHIYS